MLRVLHASSSLRGPCALAVVPLLLLGTGLRALCALTRADQLKTQGPLGGLQLSLWGSLLSAVLSSLLLPEFFTQCPQRRGTRASVWDPRTCTVAGHCAGYRQWADKLLGSPHFPQSQQTPVPRSRVVQSKSLICSVNWGGMINSVPITPSWSEAEVLCLCVLKYTLHVNYTLGGVRGRIFDVHLPAPPVVVCSVLLSRSPSSEDSAIPNGSHSSRGHPSGGPTHLTSLRF